MKTAEDRLLRWVRENGPKWRRLTSIERNGIVQLAGLLHRDIAMEGLDVTD